MHTHHPNHQPPVDPFPWEFIMVFPFIMAAIGYCMAVVISNRQYKPWPLHRTVLWIMGLACGSAAVIGPIATLAHTDFTMHMLVHLLLGMLAPLFIVLAAPMTLLLRSLPVRYARRMTSLLRSSPIRILCSPLIASTLNVGGLWVLYTTNLYTSMQHNIVFHLLIHLHVFFAGYLFTLSMIDIEPTPHRVSYGYRATVLVFAMAGHAILSKFIYVHPPMGVDLHQAQVSSKLMYYGGDLIELIMIFFLCYQWYKSTRPHQPIPLNGDTI